MKAIDLIPLIVKKIRNCLFVIGRKHYLCIISELSCNAFLFPVTSDTGVLAAPGGGERNFAVEAADKPNIPDISDFIICAPSMPGKMTSIFIC